MNVHSITKRCEAYSLAFTALNVDADSKGLHCADCVYFRKERGRCTFYRFTVLGGSPMGGVPVFATDERRPCVNFRSCFVEYSQ